MEPKKKDPYVFVGPPNQDDPRFMPNPRTGQVGFEPEMRMFLSALDNEATARGMPGKIVEQTGGFRTPEKQISLFLQEKTPKKIPTKTIYGMHMLNKAADVRPKDYSKREEYWALKDRMATDLGMGLVEGDAPHVQSKRASKSEDPSRQMIHDYLKQSDPSLSDRIADRYEYIAERQKGKPRLQRSMMREAKFIRENFGTLARPPAAAPAPPSGPTPYQKASMSALDLLKQGVNEVVQQSSADMAVRGQRLPQTAIGGNGGR